MARTKATMEIRSMARGYTAKCVQVLAGLMTNEQTPPNTRVQAAMALLDRGWGKPVQGVAGEPDEPPVRVVVTYADPAPK